MKILSLEQYKEVSRKIPFRGRIILDGTSFPLSFAYGDIAEVFWELEKLRKTNGQENRMEALKQLWGLLFPNYPAKDKTPGALEVLEGYVDSVILPFMYLCSCTLGEAYVLGVQKRRRFFRRLKWWLYYRAAKKAGGCR